MEGPLPYIILVVVAVMVFMEQLVILSFISPGSYAVIFVSFLAFAGDVPLVLMAVMMFVAAQSGTHLQYYLGQQHGERVLRWMNRYPRLVDLEKMNDIQVSSSVVVLSYNLPQIRGIVPFLAGVSHMPLKRWWVASVIGVLIWLASFIGLGMGAAALFDGDLEKALEWIWALNNSYLGLIFWVATVVLVGYYIWRRRQAANIQHSPD